jgi:hypothetical protein
MARALIDPSKRDERAGEAPAPVVELRYKPKVRPKIGEGDRAGCYDMRMMSSSPAKVSKGSL